MALAQPLAQQREMPGQPLPPETVVFRQFSGVNQTDSRTAIDDREFAWLENAMPIGNGHVELVPAPSAPVATLPVDIATLWGFTLLGNPILMAVGVDGSIRQVTPAGGVTVVAGASAVSARCRMSLWQDTEILIVDPSTGYHKWDGTTFTTIDATRLGRDVAVFEGRAWIVTGRRTITFSAPTTNNDFNPANGAGSFVVNDAAFVGSIKRLLSAVSQLWIVGEGAVNAITNVQTLGSPLVTVFSNTNIVTNVGTIYPSSVTSFMRTFLFLTTYGVYAIVGSTPQKLSEKLDGLFPLLHTHDDEPAGVCTVRGVFTWAVRVHYHDPDLGHRPLLLCFAQGKWFFASPNMTTTGWEWITSLLVDGVPTLWATNGAEIVRVFATDNADVTYKIQTKLWDFGDATIQKIMTRVGLEFQSDEFVQPNMIIENERQPAAQALPVFALNSITFVGSGPITFVGAGPITWITLGRVTARASTNMIGNYIGMTLTGTDRPWTLSAIFAEFKRGGAWIT